MLVDSTCLQVVRYQIEDVVAVRKTEIQRRWGSGAARSVASWLERIKDSALLHAGAARCRNLRRLNYPAATLFICEVACSGVGSILRIIRMVGNKSADIRA